MTINIFEKQYQKHGLKAQRLYPNEELLRFMGHYYFGMSGEERKRTKVLEVGCGSGANLWMIAKEGFDTFGIDGSEKGLKLCAEHLTKRWGVYAKLKKADFGELPYPSNYFDAVVDVVSLQHTSIQQKLKAYFEICRVLKEGGRFFSYHLGKESTNYEPAKEKIIDAYTIENISNPQMPLANNGIVSFLTMDKAREMLSQCGFKDITIEQVLKSYGDQAAHVEYLAISCEKRKGSEAL